MPSAPPISDSTRLSVSSWRMMRRRPAPSAERTASSRVRTRGARQQQVGDVGAADQQHESDDAEKQHRRQPRSLPIDRVVQRLERARRGPCWSAGTRAPGRRPPPPDRTARRRCRRRASSGRPPAACTAPRARGGRLTNGRIAQMLRPPEELEILRHDADDRPQDPVQS